jgi:hypothetical protein
MNPTSSNESHNTTESHEGNGNARNGRARSSQAQGPRRRSVDLARWIEVGRNVGAQMEEQVRKRPFVVLGATIGVGFAAGSVLGSRLGQWMVAAGIGYALRNMGSGTPTVERLRAGLERLAGEADVD